MTLMCLERSQSPAHKGVFLQGGRSALSGNVHPQSTNHNRKSSCSSPPLKCPDLKSQQQEAANRRAERNQQQQPQQQQSNSSRYKTELCRPYEESGSCKYGDKCQFAHGRKELRTMARHPKYKTELCRTFHSTGLCPYGPRCHFIHNSEQARKSLLTHLAGPPAAPSARAVEDQAVVPRSSVGSSDGEVSPPSSHGGTPTEAKSFDDIFQQQQPLFYPQETLLSNFQRIIDYGVFDYTSDYCDAALSVFASEKGVPGDGYGPYPVLDLCPVGPLTPTSPLDISVGGFRLPIFDAFQKV